MGLDAQGVIVLYIPQGPDNWTCCDGTRGPVAIHDG